MWESQNNNEANSNFSKESQEDLFSNHHSENKYTSIKLNSPPGYYQNNYSSQLPATERGSKNIWEDSSKIKANKKNVQINPKYTISPRKSWNNTSANSKALSPDINKSQNENQGFLDYLKKKNIQGIPEKLSWLVEESKKKQNDNNSHNNLHLSDDHLSTGENQVEIHNSEVASKIKFTQKNIHINPKFTISPQNHLLKNYIPASNQHQNIQDTFDLLKGKTYDDRARSHLSYSKQNPQESSINNQAKMNQSSLDYYHELNQKITEETNQQWYERNKQFKIYKPRTWYPKENTSRKSLVLDKIINNQENFFEDFSPAPKIKDQPQTEKNVIMISPKSPETKLCPIAERIYRSKMQLKLNFYSPDGKSTLLHNSFSTPQSPGKNENKSNLRRYLQKSNIRPIHEERKIQDDSKSEELYSPTGKISKKRKDIENLRRNIKYAHQKQKTRKSWNNTAHNSKAPSPDLKKCQNETKSFLDYLKLKNIKGIPERYCWLVEDRKKQNDNYHFNLNLSVDHFSPDGTKVEIYNLNELKDQKSKNKEIKQGNQSQENMINCNDFSLKAHAYVHKIAKNNQENPRPHQLKINRYFSPYRNQINSSPPKYRRIHDGKFNK